MQNIMRSLCYGIDIKLNLPNTVSQNSRRKSQVHLTVIVDYCSISNNVLLVQAQFRSALKSLQAVAAVIPNKRNHKTVQTFVFV